MFDMTYITDTDELANLNENSIIDKISKEFSDIKKSISKKTVSSKDIKLSVEKLLAHSPDEILTGLPSMFSILQSCIVIGIPMIINPVLAVPAIIANAVIKTNIDSKMIGRYISRYNIEIRNARAKANKDEKNREFFEKYAEQLEKARDTLMERKVKLRQEYDDEEEKGTSKTLELIKDSLDLFEFHFNQLSLEEKINLVGDQVFEEEIDESKLNDIKMKAKTVKKTIENKRDKMDKWFNDTLVDLRTKFRNQKRDEVVEESFPKLSKMIKRAIVLGGAAYLDPAIAALTAAVMFVCSKKADDKARKRLLSDISRELEIVEEKIKDADSNGDKEAKYELMRTRQKLNYSKDKIKGLIK